MENYVELIIQFWPLIYLIVTLIICVVFEIDPISAILWILFPIIFPIIWIKRWIKNSK